MNENKNTTLNLYNKALESCDCINKIIDADTNFNYKEFIKHMLTIYPFTSLGNLAGYFDNISPEIKDLLVNFRNNYDYILYKANEYLLKKAMQKVPSNYHEHFKFLFIDEIFNDNLPSITTIKQRKKGFIYFDNNLELVSDIDSWLTNHNILIESIVKSNDVKGSIAYSGVVTGKVCQIYKKEDFSKFNEGDILVTTMTTPKFTPILKKASGIITDEGGITCHAGIIARELKIPCIVGCKNATTILKDGMVIEENADLGIVNILTNEK